MHKFEEIPESGGKCTKGKPMLGLGRRIGDGEKRNFLKDKQKSVVTGALRIK